MSNPKLHIKGKYWSAEDGFRYCEKIARSHYENFPVASFFIPKEMRKYIWTIYAFARIADDYADEPGYTLAERIDNLHQWDLYLEECYNGNPTHRVFAALAETVERFQIPIELFKNLLTAFRSDVTVKKYQTYEDLLSYCSNSANPIGRLILLLFNYRSELMMQYSDFICTALQLTNFWQDVSIDLNKERIYIPMEDIEEFDLTEQEILNKVFDDRFRNLMAFQTRRTADLFIEGKPLLSLVGKELSLELKLIWGGGTFVLQKIHAQDYNVLNKRPVITKFETIKLLFQSFLS